MTVVAQRDDDDVGAIAEHLWTLSREIVIHPLHYKKNLLELVFVLFNFVLTTKKLTQPLNRF